MENFKRNFITIVGSISLIVVVFCLNLLVQDLVNVRIDCTTDGKFTLSKASLSVIKELKTPVEIRFYYSKDSNDMPSEYKNYARRVHYLLNEYAGASNYIHLQLLNPKFQSVASEVAQFDGLKPLKIVDSNVLYFGLNISSLDSSETFSELPLNEESLLEYKITRALLQVTEREKPQLAVISPFPIMGSEVSAEMVQRGERPVSGWKTFADLSEDYKITYLKPSADSLPANFSGVVFLLHPVGLSDELKKSIDLFVHDGGNLIICVDPCSMLARGLLANAKNNDFSNMVSSDLPEFFSAWGVKYNPGLVIADNQLGRRVNNQALLTLVDYFQNNCNKENLATTKLNHLTMVFGGALEFEQPENCQIKADYLLNSSQDAMLVPSADATDVAKIMAQFISANDSFTSILQLRGKLPSVFKQNSANDAKESSVIILADSDLFYDQVVIQESKKNDQVTRRILNDNLILLNNLVELQSKRNHLVDIRSRQVTARPLTKFIKMQADADSKFKDKIMAKHQELTQATKAYEEMAQLEKENNVIISREQKEAFRQAERTQKRLISEIKDATRELHLDVQNTKNLVKWYGTAFIPIIILVVGILVMIIKNWRSRAR